MTSKKGDELYKKAEGHVNAFFFKDYDKAYENYQASATQYKLDKNYAKAGEAYMRAGDCAVRQKNQMEASQAYVDSANSYKKCDLRMASTMLQIAIQMNIDSNRLAAAARLEKDFAETLEADGELEDSIAHFEKAAQYFFAEDQNQSANSCKVKIAKLYGEIDKFGKAMELYEELGKIYADGPLKHQAKEHFVRALICRATTVNNDNRMEAASECREAFDNYQLIDPNLRNTREAQFCDGLVSSLEENCLEKFDDVVSELSDLRMLDDWKTHALLIVKKSFEDLT
eukprot:Tbor_TRINITY_DN4744_c0_g2::TRINITY_DN4744_c0_g2_i1::g.17037::m.17037/K15296/NAPA, SNAPA, SEC17; alpha-soluble NSF attachment protein